MRRLAPALRGRLTRRAIVHSPHTWNATAATFVMFAISDLVVAFTVPELDASRLFPLSAFIGAIGITIFLTKPPEPRSAGTHLLVAAVYVGVSAAIFAHAPQGGGIVGTGIFIPVLTALWIEERRHAAGHLIIAFICMLAAAILGGNDTGTIVAVLCFIPACVLLYGATTLVLDAVEAQGAALDALALRDPLTGVGNRRMLDAELSVELTRHAGAGRPVAVVDVGLVEFVALNERVGRAAGDAVLTAVARTLSEHAPRSATVTRLDGDRFVVVLPDRDAAQAEEYVDHVRAIMPTHAGGEPLIMLAGISASPADGRTPEDLLIAAADRRRADAGRPTTAHAARADAAPWTLVLTGLDVAPPPKLPRRVSRPDIALDPLIWRAIGGAVLVYSVAITIAQLLTGELAGPAFPVLAGAAFAVAFWILLSPPAHIDGWRNHAVIASGYLLPFGAMLTAAPHAAWAVGTGLLAPLLTSVRLADRRKILFHFSVITVFCIALMASLKVDLPATIALSELIINTWVLGLTTAIVFEAAEAQWQEIDGLLLRDPLTGAGNRDLLEQRLAEELPRHDTLQMSLALLEFDLIGFDEVLRRDGRGAANHILRDVALVASGVVGPQATVSRISGCTFQILLPLADLDDLSPERAETLLRDLRAAVVGISRRGRTLVARIGVAQYPEDAATAEGLIALATERRLADDPYAHPIDVPGRPSSTVPQPLPEGTPAPTFGAHDARPAPRRNAS